MTDPCAKCSRAAHFHFLDGGGLLCPDHAALHCMGLVKDMLERSRIPDPSVASGRRIFKTSLNAEQVREMFDYNPATGIFLWKSPTNPNSTPIGSIAGSANANGYHSILIFRSRYLAHRLAWLYMTGEWPTALIDHIDGNRQNNAFSNLREATDAHNNQNRKADGYSFSERDQIYRAKICVNGQTIHLGMFQTADEARAAYIDANKKYFGEFSPFNSDPSVDLSSPDVSPAAPSPSAPAIGAAGNSFDDGIPAFLDRRKTTTSRVIASNAIQVPKSSSDMSSPSSASA